MATSPRTAAPARNGRTLYCLRLLLLTWLGSFVLAMIVPVTASSGSWTLAAYACGLYIGVAWLTAASLGGTYAPVAGPRASASQKLADDRTWFICLLTALSASGLIALYYDRVFIQGINFDVNIAAAREEWRLAGEERQGQSSSIFSVYGHMVWSISYAAITLVLFRWEETHRWLRWGIFGASIVVCQSVSALNGGRAPMLLAFAVVVCSLIVRRAYGMTAIPAVPAWVKALVAAAGIGLVAYFPYVSMLRAENSNMSYRLYTIDGIEFLHGSPSESFAHIDTASEYVGDGVYVYFLAVAQWVHPFWVMEDVLQLNTQPGSVILHTFLYYLQKLNLYNGPNDEWEFSGLFLPLPGAVYYDLGWAGLIVIAALHGLCLALCERALRGARVYVYQLMFIIPILTITVLSPLLPAMVAGGFPGMILGFGLAAALWRDPI